jgi:hypothetical protein
MELKYLSHMIEDALDDGLVDELAVFEAELENLTDEQLRKLLPLVGISFKDNNSVDRDNMIAVMDETTWGDFFTAYRKVTGKPFTLDAL